MPIADGQVDDLTCATCTSPLVFDPASQSMHCETCGSVRPAGVGTAALATVSARCRRCGAQACGRASTLIDPCSFCGGDMVSTRKGDLSWPNAIIPFQMSRSEAEARLDDWLADMPSPPNRISDHAEVDRPLESVYLPFYRFTHLSGSEASITARSACPQLGRFLGRGDVLEDAWRSLPFRPFHVDFVAGHTVTLPQTSMREAIRAEAGRPTTSDMKLSNGLPLRPNQEPLTLDGCLRVLAPVWLGSYRWDNERFCVAIDGVTGTILGARPEDGIQDIRGTSTVVEWAMYGTYALAMGTIAVVTIAWLI